MTRKATWSNADGLIVGFGPSYNERDVAGSIKSFGANKTHKLHITYQSTFGSTGSLLTVPAGVEVKNVYLKVTTNWAGGTSLAFGDAGSTGGYITSTQGAVASLVTTNSPIVMGGAYAIATGTSATAPKAYATATDLYFTAVGTFTAGEADVYVEYA